MNSKKVAVGLGVIGVSALFYSFMRNKKANNESNFNGDSQVDNSLQEFVPKKVELMHEYMDGLRNPLTETTPVNLKAKVRLSNCSGGKCTLENGSVADNSADLIAAASTEKTIPFRTVKNKSYLESYIYPKVYDEKTRDSKEYGDFLSVDNIKATILYMINPSYAKDLKEGTIVTASNAVIQNTKDIFARILEKEVGLQSGRADKYWIEKSVENRINEGLDMTDSAFNSYSDLGDITYSREAAAILWVALNRMKNKGQSALEMLKDGWNPQVYNEIKSEIDSGVKPDEKYYNFVDEFFAGLYPNEIGHRMAFVHYPRQINSGKLPDWVLPINHSLYPKNRGASKTAGGIVVGSAIFADSRYDPNTKKHILPYTDNKRNK